MVVLAHQVHIGLSIITKSPNRISTNHATEHRATCQQTAKNPQNSGQNKHINPSTAQQRSGEHRGTPNQHNTKQPRNTTQRNNHDNQHTHHQKPARTRRSNRPEQKTLTRCISTQNHRYFLPLVVTPGHMTAA